VDSKGCR
jgi:hypothetical protein